MERRGLGPTVLAQAAMKIGGPAALARYLDVPPATLDRWLLGHEVPPAETLRRAVDLVREYR